MLVVVEVISAIVGAVVTLKPALLAANEDSKNCKGVFHPYTTSIQPHAVIV